MLKKVYKHLIEPLTKMVEETKRTRLALKDAPRELLTMNLRRDWHKIHQTQKELTQKD
jgi:hypothetical protein